MSETYDHDAVTGTLARREGLRGHPRVQGAVLLTVATWPLVLGAILCAHGYQWGALLFAAAVLEGWFGYRRLATTRQ